METKQQIFLEEQAHLDYAVEAMSWERTHHQNQLHILPQTYRDDPRLLQVLMGISASRIKRIDELKGKPYFARIDFGEESKRPQKIYIGKTAVTDEKGADAVIDWRAPVCTLYYDSNLGPAIYTAPMGEIVGELLLKRQLIMEEGILKEYYDVDSVSDDELLKPYLGANADNRLKTIVASIGKEQNKIIRWPFRQNLIVQGVAGSGKTTVALHRAAYLIYNEREKCKASQFMVIGPNRYFIQYISSVLPDLETEDIKQSVFEDIATAYVGEKLKAAPGSLSLDKVMEGKENTAVQRFKTSLDYKQCLDAFFTDFCTGLFTEDIYIDTVKVIGKEELLEVFMGHAIVPDLKARLGQTIATIRNRIRHSPEALLDQINRHYKRQIAASPKGEAMMKLYDALHKAEKEIQSGCVKLMEQYFAPAGISVTALYRQFAKEITHYVPEELDPDQMGREITALLGKKTVSFEDTPAIIYLKLLLHGAGDYKNFVHILVDEAQDFGLFHYDCLRRLFPESSFTIVGDLAQGIYSYRSIGAWEEVVEQVFGQSCSLLYLEKSYRTTIEIMECANLALKALGSPAAVPVIRSGDAPRLIRLKEEQLAQHIQSTVAQYTPQGLKSFAVITKNEKQAAAIGKALQKQGVAFGTVKDSEGEAASSLTVLTGYQAKGLEFDCVLIPYADSQSYRSDSTLDMRLLFVAMSRALHQMELIIGLDAQPALGGFEALGNR